MRFRTWPVAAIGLASLLLLTVVAMLTIVSKAQDIYVQVERVNAHHDEVDAKLRRLRSDVNLSGIFVRDYLLDIARERAPEYRQRLAELRAGHTVTFAELRALAPAHEANILSLQAQLDDYWQVFDPLFDWTLSEKIFRSATFLRTEVVPRRDAALAIAQDIEELNNANLADQRRQVSQQYDAFADDLGRLLWQTILLGLGVALAVVFRLRVLEGRSDEQRAIAEAAERQMRQLSQRLVATQEEERRSLSRELHDHVGQMLTALRMELGRIERGRTRGDMSVGPAVTEARQLVDGMVRIVRDLALGLRPSMLDDLGLRAALEWLVRDTARRSGIDVDARIEGDVDTLPDRYQTCVYRVVQESLTNCLRHAGARSVQVDVRRAANQLDISVLDDGHGFDVDERAGGLGLRGIEERVRELGGRMTITSGARGTRLWMRLPLPQAEAEVRLARVAG